MVSTHARGERRRRTVPDEGALLAAVSTASTPLEAAEQRAALSRVDQALATLDLNLRAVFILYEIEEQPCDAIAAGLAIPVGTVYSRLSAARRAFLDAYARLERGSPGTRARQKPAHEHEGGET